MTCESRRLFRQGILLFGLFYLPLADGAHIITYLFWFRGRKGFCRSIRFLVSPAIIVRAWLQGIWLPSILSEQALEELRVSTKSVLRLDVETISIKEVRFKLGAIVVDVSGGE